MRAPLLCVVLLSGFASAQTGVIKPRVTAQEVTQRQQASPLTQLEQPGKEAIVARPEDQSIIRHSIILNDGKHWTLVPKGAVIFKPEAQQSRVDGKPVGTLLPFQKFLANNFSWITTNEVSLDQAAGTEGLPTDKTEFWARQDKVVIAVHQGGPISVNIAKPAPTVTQR